MKKLALLAAVAAACAAAFTATASADYGPHAYRQVELSANAPGRNGGGIWLWIELSPDHSADYAGSDCGHGGAGAASDKGDAAWTQVGDWIVITGVVLNGLPTNPPFDFSPWHTTITVPAMTGHYSATGVGAYLTLPSFIPADEGFTQLQVAP